MDVGIKIIPAKQTSEAIVEDVENELKQLEGIQGAGTTSSRAIDPGSILLWVKLSVELIAAAGAAVTVAQQIINLLRKKNMSDATLEFANGTKVSVSSVSAENVAKLLQAGNG